jgi:hypothetical protein
MLEVALSALMTVTVLAVQKKKKKKEKKKHATLLGIMSGNIMGLKDDESTYLASNVWMMMMATLMKRVVLMRLYPMPYYLSHF